ncbi:MAG: exopolysaccharide biosynthesis polyprenyl glycosylphosphotransferase [Verrucomicrobiota bacterium JB023]|nr:exopolysaccharide biosynthesis polyprenyl glycosylphosphotransferase [Verrucomicrobiota bacterium JB023]
MNSTNSDIQDALSPVAGRIHPPKENYEVRHRSKAWLAHQKIIFTSFVGDLLVVVASLCAAYLVRFETFLGSVGVADFGVTLHDYFGHIIVGTVVMMGLMINFRLYDARGFLRFRPMVKSVVYACMGWSVVFMSVALVLKIDPAISRIYCMVAGFITMSFLLGWRLLLHRLIRKNSWGDALRQRVVFLGWNNECEAAMRRYNGMEGDELMVAGVVSPQIGSFEDTPPEDVPILGSFDELRRSIRETEADMLVAVNGSTDRKTLLEVSEICEREFVDFKLVPSCFQVLVSGLQLETVNGMPVLGIGKLPLHYTFNNGLKRAFDIVGALMGLCLFGPLIGLFMLLVRLESKGPVIYRQVRLGLNGRPFHIFKIRSMKTDAESSGSPGWTVKNDPRCLRVGAFMRRWNIDELPQFWNVLIGDMSLVGPRPERPELINDFKEEIPHYNVRHNIKPGLTGWAQINGLRGDTCLATRVKFDLHYMENWNFLWDLRIMALTFVKRSGAC